MLLIGYIVGPLWFACVATLGAVLSAFGFAAMMCFQSFVPGALMELAWETDHDDHVSTSAGTENVSIGNVFEIEGRCGVDFGFNTLVGCCFCRVFGLLSFRSSMFAQAPGWWAFLVAGGAAVASSYLLKMMTLQAAAAWAAAKEGLHVSEFLCASAGLHVSEFLGAYEALALLGMHVKQIKHAAASTAAANDGWCVPGSLVASVAGALKRHASKKTHQVAAASAAATAILPCVIFVVYHDHVFAFHWTLLELVFCVLGVAAVVCWFGDAGFEFLRSLERPWSGSGKWKKPSAFSGKEKNNDDPLLQAFTLVEAYECVSFKGKDGHDTDGSLSLGKGKASGRVDVPVGVNAFLSAEKFCRSEQSVAFVTPGSCVVKRIFLKGVDGNTVVHRVHGHTVVRDLLDCTEDVWVTYNGKLVQPGDTIGHIGIGNHGTSRCVGRLRGGAQRHRSQPVDVPGQRTCQACGQDRVWPVKTRCFRCGCPEGLCAATA